MLGIGDHGATNTPGTAIKTLALGSCVAVILMDPRSRTVAMAHVALPASEISIERAKDKPGYFADTALPVLLKAMSACGYTGNGKGLIVKMVGGAQVVDPNNVFNIGKRNVLALKKILWQIGMGAAAEDVGGNISRTVSVGVDDGKVVITSPGKDPWEI